MENPIAEIFDNLCPVFMSYGMSYDEYWNQDWRIAEFYAKKHFIELDRMSFSHWVLGQYFLQASHGDKQGKLHYPNEPTRITPLTEDEIKQEQLNKVLSFKQGMEELATGNTKQGNNSYVTEERRD